MYGKWPPANVFLARAGFVTVSADYRLAPTSTFPAQLEDVRAAVRWLRAHALELGIDPGRIGVWGISAGAHLAALLGTVPELISRKLGEFYRLGLIVLERRTVRVCDAAELARLAGGAAQEAGR